MSAEIINFHTRNETGDHPQEMGRIGMSTERTETIKDNSHPKVRLLIIEIIEAGERRFEPAVINERTEDPLSELVLSKTLGLRQEIEDLKEGIRKIEKTKSHHRTRSEREIRDIRLSRLAEVTRKQALVDVLEGRRLQPVRLIRVGDELEEIRLSSFGTKSQTLQSKELNLNVEELLRKFPEGIDLLVEGFRLRSKMKFAQSPKEKDKARLEYDGFIEKYRTLPERKASLLTPTMRFLSEALGN